MAKYCTQCGKQNNDEAIYCKYCGAKFYEKYVNTEVPINKLNKELSIREEPLENRNIKSKFQKKKSPLSGNDKFSRKLVIAVTIVVIIVLITAIVGAILYFGRSSESTNMKETELVKDSESKSEDNNNDNDDGEYFESKSESDSDFIIGEIYTVQTNLRVREGPGKDYEILDRYDLDSYYYSNSVEPTTTASDAALKKGCKVTCEGMSGKWMKISCGWICVEDDGEVLVK